MRSDDESDAMVDCPGSCSYDSFCFCCVVSEIYPFSHS